MMHICYNEFDPFSPSPQNYENKMQKCCFH